MKAGILTVNDLAKQMPYKLADRAGIGESTAEEAINQAIKIVNKGYMLGTQLHEDLKKRKRLTTGSYALDKILGGGLESGTTNEVAGKNGSGKTQLMHMIAITTQLPEEQGGLGGEVAWIDTEETFRPDRILQICETRGLDGEKMLEGIHVAQAYNTQHQRMLTEELTRVCQEHPVKLIIVDSMMAHLRSEYIGRGMLARRQNVLSDMLQEIGKVVQTHGITAVYTNQVMDNPAVTYANPEKAVGGHIMGHAGTIRIHIRKGRNEKRVAKVVKSPYLPEHEAVFLVNEYGVQDTEDVREEYEGGDEG